MNRLTKTAAMARALALAERAAAAGEVPVGAVVVDSMTGAVVAEAANRTETDSDPTAHAEMLAIRAAAALRGRPRLADCDLYVTLEPCPMCAQAIAFARIRRLYFGAPDPKGGGVEHGPRIFAQPSCHHRPEIYGGIAERDAAVLLKAFFDDNDMYLYTVNAFPHGPFKNQVIKEQIMWIGDNAAVSLFGIGLNIVRCHQVQFRPRPVNDNGSEPTELVVDLHLHNDKRRPEAVFKKRFRLFCVNRSPLAEDAGGWKKRPDKVVGGA